MINSQDFKNPGKLDNGSQQIGQQDNVNDLTNPRKWKIDELQEIG